MCCFLEKITQLTKILHDRRSRRSRQIPSLIIDGIASVQGLDIQYVCLYILKQVEICSGDTDPSFTDRQTRKEGATQAPGK